VDPGFVGRPVRTWLRLEGLAALLLAAYIYAASGASWTLFAVLFLAPDVSLAGYLAGARAGGTMYNAAHSYIGPLALAAGLLATGTAPALALIWMAHIGFDRMLGYGLKYPTAFADTHLGPIGKPRRER
jgi:hypothetical protein